jgi:CubicO group peptidase (beta-lactamase class C family)
VSPIQCRCSEIDHGISDRAIGPAGCLLTAPVRSALWLAVAGHPEAQVHKRRQVMGDSCRMSTPLLRRPHSRHISYCVGVLVWLVVAAGVGPVAGDEQVFHVLRSTMTDWVREYKVRAASAAMTQNGGEIWKLGYGGMAATDPARIGSLSKAVTAVCIARLIDEGRLSFTTEVGTVLAPTFEKFGEPADARFKSVTIEQLLTHRAGLAREPKPGSRSKDMASRFKQAIATPLRSDPGGSFWYSNVGYLTLGMIVEAVTGNEYEQHCRRTALDPVGAGGFIEPALRDRAPSGGWRVSAVDYAKFMQVWEPHSRLLGARSRNWLEVRRENFTYGLGIYVLRMSRGWRYYHGGFVTSPQPPGWALTYKFENEWTVVVIYEGHISKKDRSALQQLLLATFLKH